ncbi:MAG TPA: hypothetical protein VI955_00075 [Candidatus Omnitrophota bacterium]|nr:hypothetical protein [Candidatus Omnitrophota bacterium]
MRKTFKTVLVSVLAGVFTVGSVLCCCARNIAHAGITTQKTHACCASKQTQPQKAADCEHCSVSLKSAQIAQSFDLIPSFTIAFNLLPADIVFITHTPVVYQTVWADGPPGFSSEVPFYIQSHQIRV